MKIRPRNDNVLIRVEQPETDERGLVATESGVLHEPDYEWAGVVLAVGKGQVNKYGVRIPCEAEPGTRVVCKHHEGMLFEIPEYGSHMLIRDKYLVAESDIPPA